MTNIPTLRDQVEDVVKKKKTLVLYKEDKDLDRKFYQDAANDYDFTFVKDIKDIPDGERYDVFMCLMGGPGEYSEMAKWVLGK